jgi:DNA-binding MarR family transcriptional regulator
MSPKPAEPERLQTALKILVRRFAIGERADVACCGMTVAQAATLEILEGAGAMRLGALGERLGIAPSTLSRNLARLEERGLLRRTGDDGDARAKSVELTAAGRKAAAELRRQDRAFMAGILGRLPAGKRAQVVEALEDLVGAVREATSACCPGAFEHLMRIGP